jgi:putative restriction endonuclease
MPLVLHIRESQQAGLNFEEAFRLDACSAEPIQFEDRVVIHAKCGSKSRYRYVGFGQISGITYDPDPKKVKATIADYLSFPIPVPPRINKRSYENPSHGLRRLRDHHAEQQALRWLSNSEYVAILHKGLGELSAPKAQIYSAAMPTEHYDDSIDSEIRRIIEITIQRPFRAAANRRLRLIAYPQGCAVTGDVFSIEPGQTLCEVNHIKPVGDGGPDSIRNLILLSPSAHRAWNSGMISLGDDGQILRSPRLKSHELRGRSEHPNVAWLPAAPSQRPAAAFLQWHRQNRFLLT